MAAMREGQFTRAVYEHIKEKDFGKAIELLEPIVQALPSNRAALSLLGHAYYHQGRYESACQAYEALVLNFPSRSEYRLHHAQSLYKSGDLVEAVRVLEVISDHPDQVDQLRMAIAYASDQAQDCRRMLQTWSSESAATCQNEGCVLYKEGEYSQARDKFQSAIDLLGSVPALMYSIALYHYKLGQHGEALKNLAKVIEQGVSEHPQLSIGVSATVDSDDVMSVGNSQILQSTAFVEAFNLKAAIEYKLKNTPAAKEALADMPPRDLSELDPCTLHNRALLNMDSDPEEGFQTLTFLLSNPPFPSETFANLLLLYIKPPHSMHDVAADTIAQHPEYAAKLPAELLAFLDAVTLKQSAPEEAYEQFERMAKQHVDKMRLLTKMIQDARHATNGDTLTKKVQEYDDALEAYVPILMAQAHIFWEMGQYSNVLKVLNQSKEFASEHDMWKLNMAHTYFALDSPASKGDNATRDNFLKAILYYEPTIARSRTAGKLLDVPAMVIANLCVAYIMIEKNHEAEELMKAIEGEESAAMETVAQPTVLHSCIVNLVIGTLYCAKQNYEFGLSRVMKALLPLDTKLEADTWFYAKRCFLAFADGLAKHMIFIHDKSFDDCVDFLERTAAAGRDVPVSVNMMDKSSRCVSDEAVILRTALLDSRDAASELIAA